jgi:sortase (surface protein transpeptidase)
MKFILILIFIYNSILLAGSIDEKERKNRAQAQLKIEMQKEKKYAQERTFYQNHNYDFKGAEVNPDSLDSVPSIEVDDFDMDSVYD